MVQYKKTADVDLLHLLDGVSDATAATLTAMTNETCLRLPGYEPNAVGWGPWSGIFTTTTPPS